MDQNNNSSPKKTPPPVPPGYSSASSGPPPVPPSHSPVPPDTAETPTGITDAPSSALQYKCKSCGGSMSYSPKYKMLRCGYCGSTRELDLTPAEIEENDFETWAAQNQEGLAGTTSLLEMEAQQVKCEQCYASFSIAADKSSANCPFCGTPFVLEKAQIKRFWQPEYIVPFSIDRSQCDQLFGNWLKGKWFLPNKFKRGDVVAKEFKGVYLPYWTYDAETTTSYTGQRGKHYTVTRKDSKGNTYTETETSWTYTSGTVSRFFDDVLVDASATLPFDIKKGLNKYWNLGELVEYSEQFASGFVTDLYTVDFTEGLEVAKQKMKVCITRDVESDIGGDEQRIDTMNTKYDEVKFKLILLPIWIGAFQIDQKLYQFVINGQNGVVYGKYPKSKWKIAFVCLIAILIAAFFYWLMGLLE